MNKSKVTKAASAKKPVKTVVSSELIKLLVKKDIESLASGGSATSCSNGMRALPNAS